MLPNYVAWSSSGTLTMGRIAYRREGGDGSAQRGRSVIYDCLVLCVISVIKKCRCAGTAYQCNKLHCRMFITYLPKNINIYQISNIFCISCKVQFGGYKSFISPWVRPCVTPCLVLTATAPPRRGYTGCDIISTISAFYFASRAQLGGSLYRAPKLHPGPCNTAGMRPRTDRHTQRRA